MASSSEEDPDEHLHTSPRVRVRNPWKPPPKPGYKTCLLNRYALTEYPGNTAISSIVFLLAQSC